MLQSFTLKEWQYVHSLIDRSEFRTALTFFSKARLPSIKKSCLDDLYFMEAFVRLLIAQGFQKKALPIISSVIERLYLSNLHTEHLMAKLLIHQAQALSAVEENARVLPLYMEAYDILENKSDNQSDYGYIYLGLSQCDEKVNDWEMYLENSLDCFRRVNNPVGESAALNAYGIYFGRIQDSGLALDYFQKAQSLSKENNDLRRFAGILNNQAVLVYLEEPNSDESHAMDLLFKAVDISKKIESYEYLTQHHKALAQYYHNKKENMSAIPHLKTIFKLQEKRGLLTSVHKQRYHELIFDKSPLIKQT